MITLQLPVTDDGERVKVKPIAILDKKPMKKGNHAVVMRLIQWLNLIKKGYHLRGVWGIVQTIFRV